MGSGLGSTEVATIFRIGGRGAFRCVTESRRNGRIDMVRFQYRLRSLLVLVTIMAIPLGWIPWKRREIESRQKEIEIAERNLRCNVDYDYEMDGSSPPGPGWLRALLGDRAFAEPRVECLWTNGNLSCLRDCPRLTRLAIGSGAVASERIPGARRPSAPDGALPHRRDGR